MPATPVAVADAWDVKRLLEWTTAFFARKSIDAPRVSAEMILGHVLSLERIRLYTQIDRALTAQELAAFRDLVKRAGEHEPVQYLVGKAHFFSLELAVSPAVLIPRPDTETLVDAVLRRLKLEGKSHEPLRVLDLFTGSGAIAVALAKHLPAAMFVATDISAEAATVAKNNADTLGVGARVDVRVGDLFEPVAGEMPFDVITANPPYVPSGDIARLDRNVRDYEPHLALDGGPDGLDAFHRLLREAPAHLTIGGRLYAEMQFDQAATLKGLAEASGAWVNVQVERDLAGHERALILTRPA